MLVGVLAHAEQSGLHDRLLEAKSLQKKGALERALPIYEALLNALRSGPASAELGEVLSGISQISLSQGNYGKAIESANEAATVYRSMKDTVGEARALNDKAIAEIEHGDYPAAQVDLRTALARCRDAGDAETEVKTLNNRGSAYFFQGKYLEAQRDYESATHALAQNKRQSWTPYWEQITDFNQATLYQRLGRYEKALQIYRDVRDAFDKDLSPSDRAHLLTNLGALYRRLGDPVKALESYQSALDLYSRQRDADGEIGTLKNIGIVNAMDVGKLDKAREVFGQALTLAQKSHNRREEMQAHLYLGETLLRKGELQNSSTEFQTALDSAISLGTSEEQWKALYGLGKTKEAVGSADRGESDFRHAISIIETTRAQLQLSALRAEFLADKRDAYDALIALLLEKGDAEEAFSILERSRARTFQDRLLNKDSADRPALSLAETQQHLDDSTVLLEFWTSKDHIGLIWCTRSARGMAEYQLTSQELSNIRDLLKGFPHDLAENWKQQVGVLRKLLPGDVSFLSANLKHLLIIPDGWLSFVPLEVVPLSQNSLLVENFDISYLPTAALLRRDPVQPRLRLPWTRELIAFGDPQTQPGSQALATSDGLAALPHSGEEIRSISNMANGKTELLLGGSDLKNVFLEGKANSALILHVSTHAVADADNPENSRLLFSAEEPETTPDYVYLRELYDLKLDDVNLATLSACDTERGKMARGEGVEAFSRALLSAGSRASLTTLGRVDDQATAEFMKQFYYFALKKRYTKSESLRLAKLKFLHSGTKLSNPAYWAAFVLNGEGLTPLPKVVSWAELAMGTAGAILMLLLAGFWLRSRSRRNGQHHS